MRRKNIGWKRRKTFELRDQKVIWDWIASTRSERGRSHVKSIKGWMEAFTETKRNLLYTSFGSLCEKNLSLFTSSTSSFTKLIFFSHYRSLPHSIAQFASRHVIKNSSTRRFLLGSLNFNRFFISISDAMIYFCVHTILKNGKSIDSAMISFCQNKIDCRFFEWAKNVRNFFRRQLN